MAWLDTIKQGAIQCWHKYQILPSLTGAQAVIESGWGGSKLAQPPNNNCFGIKASGDWTGRKVNMRTREVLNGVSQYIYADFRAYDSISDSVRDHGEFFTSTDWRKKNYAAVIGEKDYKKACYAVARAGYATDPNYASSLIRVIEQNKLYNWDQEAFNGNFGEVNEDPQAPVSSESKVMKTVGGPVTEQALAAVRNFKTTWEGDSLLVGSKPYVTKYLNNPVVDGYVSRQITHSDPIYDATVQIQKLKDAGKIGDYVVAILGTNRGVTEQEVLNFVNICGPDRKVLLVDTASEVAHAKSVSMIYRKLAIEHTNIFHVAWYDHARPQIDNLYARDGANGAHIHMLPQGYKKHVEFIIQALYEASTYVNKPIEVEREKTKKQVDIKNIELKTDGTLIYHMDRNLGLSGGEDKQEKNIGITGFYSPLGDNNIYCPDSNEKWGFDVIGKNAKWLEDTFKDDNETDSLKLFEKGLAELKSRVNAASQYKVKLRSADFNLSIGDTGVFIDHEAIPPIYIEGRILQMTTSFSDEDYIEVTIGNVVELFVEKNRAIEKLQSELIEQRELLKEEWIENPNITGEVISSSGLTLSENVSQTMLMVKLKHDNVEFEYQPDWYVYEWFRVSDDKEADAIYNADLLEAEDKPNLTVLLTDLVGKQSSFMCRVKQPTGEIVTTVGAIIKEAVRGLSNYEIAVKNGFEGTEIEWLKSIEGVPGPQGIPGEPGEDGKPSYTHIAYADGTNGENFSVSEPGSRKYIGSYVDEFPDDPTDYKLYKWQLVQGPKGDNAHVHTAWANFTDSVVEFSKLAETVTTGQFNTIGDLAPIFDRNGLKDLYTLEIDVAYNNQSETYPQSRIYMQNGSTFKYGFIWSLLDGLTNVYKTYKFPNLSPSIFNANEVKAMLSLYVSDTTNTLKYKNVRITKQGSISDFSTTVSSGRSHMGTYSDNEVAHSQDYKKYSWVKVQGEAGTNDINLFENGSGVVIDTWNNVGLYTDYKFLGTLEIMEIDKKVKPNDFITIGFDIEAEKAFTLQVYDSNVNNLLKFDPVANYVSVGPGTQRVYVTVKLTDVGVKLMNRHRLDLYNANNGINFRISNVKIQLGKTGTPYSKSPEELQKEVDSKVNQIDYNNVLKILSEQVQTLQALSTDMEITKNNALITHVDEVMRTITKLVGDVNNIDLQAKLVEEVINQVSTYFKFDSALTIGKSDSKITIKIDNERMEFKDGETVMAWLSGNVFNAQNIVINGSLSWPTHEFKSDTDGLEIRWIGG